MALPQLAGVAGNSAVQSVAGGAKGASFGQALSQAQNSAPKPGTSPASGSPSPAAPGAIPTGTTAHPAQTHATAGVSSVRGISQAPIAAPAKASSVAHAMDRLNAAQGRMDRVLALAQSGRDFSPAELLSLQTQVCQASQELDLAGKVLEKATGGIKQVLQTQV